MAKFVTPTELALTIVVLVVALLLRPL